MASLVLFTINIGGNFFKSFYMGLGNRWNGKFLCEALGKLSSPKQQQVQSVDTNFFYFIQIKILSPLMPMENIIIIKTWNHWI